MELLMASSRNSANHCDCFTAVDDEQFLLLQQRGVSQNWSSLKVHLSNLSLISIEHKTMEKINFDQVNSNFLLQKLD